MAAKLGLKKLKQALVGKEDATIIKDAPVNTQRRGLDGYTKIEALRSISANNLQDQEKYNVNLDPNGGQPLPYLKCRLPRQMLNVGYTDDEQDLMKLGVDSLTYSPCSKFLLIQSAGQSLFTLYKVSESGLEPTQKKLWRKPPVNSEEKVKWYDFNTGKLVEPAESKSYAQSSSEVPKLPSVLADYQDLLNKQEQDFEARLLREDDETQMDIDDDQIPTVPHIFQVKANNVIFLPDRTHMMSFAVLDDPEEDRYLKAKKEAEANGDEALDEDPDENENQESKAENVTLAQLWDLTETPPRLVMTKKFKVGRLMRYPIRFSFTYLNDGEHICKFPNPRAQPNGIFVWRDEAAVQDDVTSKPFKNHVLYISIRDIFNQNYKLNKSVGGNQSSPDTKPPVDDMTEDKIKPEDQWQLNDDPKPKSKAGGSKKKKGAEDAEEGEEEENEEDEDEEELQRKQDQMKKEMNQNRKLDFNMRKVLMKLPRNAIINDDFDTHSAYIIGHRVIAIVSTKDADDQEKNVNASDSDLKPDINVFTIPYDESEDEESDRQLEYHLKFEYHITFGNIEVSPAKLGLFIKQHKTSANGVDVTDTWYYNALGPVEHKNVNPRDAKRMFLGMNEEEFDSNPDMFAYYQDTIFFRGTTNSVVGFMRGEKKCHRIFEYKCIENVDEEETSMIEFGASPDCKYLAVVRSLKGKFGDHLDPYVSLFKINIGYATETTFLNNRFSKSDIASKEWWFTAHQEMNTGFVLDFDTQTIYVLEPTFDHDAPFKMASALVPFKWPPGAYNTDDCLIKRVKNKDRDLAIVVLALGDNSGDYLEQNEPTHEVFEIDLKTSKLRTLKMMQNTNMNVEVDYDICPTGIVSFEYKEVEAQKKKSGDTVKKKSTTVRNEYFDWVKSKSSESEIEIEFANYKFFGGRGSASSLKLCQMLLTKDKDGKVDKQTHIFVIYEEDQVVIKQARFPDYYKHNRVVPFNKSYCVLFIEFPFAAIYDARQEKVLRYVKMGKSRNLSGCDFSITLDDKFLILTDNLERSVTVIEIDTGRQYTLFKQKRNLRVSNIEVQYPSTKTILVNVTYMSNKIIETFVYCTETFRLIKTMFPPYNCTFISNGSNYILYSSDYLLKSLTRIEVHRFESADFDFPLHIELKMDQILNAENEKEEADDVDVLVWLIEKRLDWSAVADNELLSRMVIMLNNYRVTHAYANFIGIETLFMKHHLFYTILMKEPAPSSVNAILACLNEFQKKEKRLPFFNKLELESLIYGSPDVRLKIVSDEGKRSFISSCLMKKVPGTYTLKVINSERPITEMSFAPNLLSYSEANAVKSSIRELVDEFPSDKQVHLAYRSILPLDLKSGSFKSRKLFQLIQELPDDLVEKNLKELIYFKWYDLMFLAGVYVTGFWAICIFAYIYYPDPTDYYTLGWFLFGLLVIYFFFEVKVLVTNILIKANVLKNVLYVLLMAFNLAITISLLTDNSKQEKAQIFSISWARVIGLVGLGYRGVDWWKISNKTRALLSMAKKVMQEVFFFLIIFTIVFLLFAIIWRLTSTLGENDPMPMVSFWQSIYDTLMITFGNSPASVIVESNVRLIILIGGNLLLAFVLGNMMIAIINKSYTEQNNEASFHNLIGILSTIQYFDSLYIERKRYVREEEYQGDYLIALREKYGEKSKEVKKVRSQFLTIRSWNLKLKLKPHSRP